MNASCCWRCRIWARTDFSTKLESVSPSSSTSSAAWRKVAGADPFLRELLIGFGKDGYVALFEIEGPDTVTVLAVRHQREDDYH